MRGKRGQFYLLAAIIIITLIVGFVTLQNYSYGKTSVKLDDLKEELAIESQNVIDYGTSSHDDWDIQLEQFIESYVNYAGAGKDLYFIFGDSGSLQVKAYQNLKLVDAPLITTEGGEIFITIDNIEYKFDLLDEENFYFIVSQEIEGEKHIVTG
jgi:hypothetical protein